MARMQPMVRFLLGFLVLQALLFGTELTPWGQRWFVVPWTDTLAAISAGIVKVFDPGVMADGKVLQSGSNGFAVSIEAGCRTLHPAGLCSGSRHGCRWHSSCGISLDRSSRGRSRC